MSPQIEKALDQIVEQQKKQTSAFEGIQELIKDRLPEPPPKAVKPKPPEGFDDLLEQLKKNAPLLARWRKTLQQNADRLGRTIAGKLADFARAPQVSASTIADALRKGAALRFDPSLLNQFNGYSHGPVQFFDSAGAPVPLPPLPELFKVWDPVVQQGPYQIQKTTMKSGGYVRPKDITPANDLHLNAYTREWGLVAWARQHEVAAQNALVERPMIVYQLAESILLWISQTVTETGEVVTPEEFLVSMNWKGYKQARPAFGLVSFIVRLDQGCVTVTGAPAMWYEAVIDNPKFQEMRQRLSAACPRLAKWRDNFKKNPQPVAAAVADAFNKTRDAGAFTTPALTARELQAAFADPRQLDDFDPADFNNFAARWNSVMYVYDRNGALQFTLKKVQTGLHLVPDKEGVVQYLTGSSTRHLDPLAVTGEEEDLLELVLDAYLPDVGICGWFSLVRPAKNESPTLCYKLAGNRYFWIAQRADSDVWDLSVETLVDTPDGRYGFLVSDTFDIDFTAGTAKPAAGQSLIKSEFKFE
jgi:hypothetical protein